MQVLALGTYRAALQRQPATPTATQLEFDFVKGDLSGKLTSFDLATRQRVLLEVGRQAKHIPGHNNFIPDRSPFTHPDPQGLLDKFAGKGEQAGKIPRGQPGFKERVDFGEVIGTMKGKPTTKGLIHYSKKGAHIVPANP